MVVFFDIDGTIVDSASQQIPASAIRAVELLGQNGHIAVVNTGRPYAHIDPRVRAMAFRGWACGCGMEVLLDSHWLHRAYPDAALRRKVMDAVRSCRMKPIYEARDGAIVLDPELDDYPDVQREAAQMRSKGFEIRTIPADGSTAEFLKFVVYSDRDSRTEEFIRQLEEDFTIIDRGNAMLELVTKGHSKAGGIAAIADHLGLSRDDTLAIGDSTNDLPMFAMAGHTVCMGDGMEELRRQAEYITATVMDGGIEKALKHYGLI